MRLQRSPSGRATCRTCATRIERGALRVAATTVERDQAVERYHHLTCLVEDDPNMAMVAMLAAPPELRSEAERLLARNTGFLAAVAHAAAAKVAAVAASDAEFDDATEAVLEQLAANPREAGPLSVLQDQLQERGLPRGELIALELAKAPETARLVELKRQLWPPVKDVRVTWGTGFLRTMSVMVRDEASAGAVEQALRHPSARLLEELSLQRWVGALPTLPASLRRLDLQWCEGAGASVEAQPRLQHLQLNHVEDAAVMRSASLQSLEFGPDVVAAPLARLVPQVSTVVFQAPESLELLAAAGLLKQARVLVLSQVWNESVLDALAQTGCTWDLLVYPRLRPNESQCRLLQRLARRAAVSLSTGVAEWVMHTARPEWGLGRVRSRTAAAIEVEFESGVRHFSPNASVLMGVEVLEGDVSG